jgi:hypothetical protein
MRLPFFTVAILACLITVVAAWSKEGKFAPDTSHFGARHGSVEANG